MKGTLKKVSELAFGHLTKPANSSVQWPRPLGASFSSKGSPPQSIPSKCDICIIGGGAMGSSTAYWLKQHPAGQKLNVVVIERDPHYAKASTTLSLGGIRQQFSNGENVQLSLFGAEFIKNLQKYIGLPDQPADIQYHAGGYLFLASTPEGAETLHENHRLQISFGSKVELLSPEKLKEKFPKMNVQDITLASYGVDNEGWFDPWSLLNGFKKKAISLGTQYVTAEVVGFDAKANDNCAPNVGPTQLRLKDATGNVRSLEFSQCVIAAGYDSGKISMMAGMGTGSGALSVPIPVEPRKRYVYYIDAPTLRETPNIPLAIDSSGTYFRPAQNAPGHFFTGRSPPTEEDEPSCENLDVDYDFFDNHVWPFLAHRLPDFENTKIKAAYGGYYDYNVFDQNGIIGTHPCFRNFHIATGFSGHGIQQSPAVGRAMMETILEGSFKTIDLTRFGFERIIEEKPCLEKNIV